MFICKSIVLIGAEKSARKSSQDEGHCAKVKGHGHLKTSWCTSPCPFGKDWHEEILGIGFENMLR